MKINLEFTLTFSYINLHLHLFKTKLFLQALSYIKLALQYLHEFSKILDIIWEMYKRRKHWMSWLQLKFYEDFVIVFFHKKINQTEQS